MCGIAGYSLSPDSSVQRTLAAQALLAGIAERGADAVGYAHRGSSASVTVHKRRSGASALLDEVHVPSASTQVLVHVRDYTKGHPTIEANNHPIRHGSVVGIHNGIILNDEEIFARYGFERAHPDMTVDSEAIFALAEHAEGSPEALEELHGAMATAWLDERNASVLFLARGRRPSPVDRHCRPRALLRLDARRALPASSRRSALTLRKREVDEGTLLRVEDGRITGTDRFKPDRSYVEETILPSVRAPHEGASCLQRLAAITLAARPN